MSWCIKLKMLLESQWNTFCFFKSLYWQLPISISRCWIYFNHRLTSKIGYHETYKLTLLEINLLAMMATKRAIIQVIWYIQGLLEGDYSRNKPVHTNCLDWALLVIFRAWIFIETLPILLIWQLQRLQYHASRMFFFRFFCFGHYFFFHFQNIGIKTNITK